MPKPTPTHTKLIATLGPKSGNERVMRGLIEAGVNIFRNNFAHCPYEEYRERQRILEELNKELGTSVQMQADIQGTSIRIGEIPGGSRYLEEGKSYHFSTLGGELKEEEILINDHSLHRDVKAGEPISFMDGALEGEITKVQGHTITVRMINSGVLKSRKSVNVPETKLSTPALTAKDRKDLNFLIHDAGVDWIALSFVSKAEEIKEVRQLIGDRPISLISKIERRAALTNLREIIEASDAIMVARGDLGIELPLEEIPILQKKITSLCHHEEKPVIIATQMLLSMTHSRRPTRAEVSDVANAVFDRADALMLSEETTEGIDPVHTLKTMVTIVRRSEAYLYGQPNFFTVAGREP